MDRNVAVMTSEVRGVPHLPSGQLHWPGQRKGATTLPDLGVGLVYWPSLEHLMKASEEVIDVLEVEPQPFWFAPSSSTALYRLDQRALEHLRRLPQPKIVHGVGFPVGGSAIPDARHLAPFAESITALSAPWASEHLSFNRARVGGTEVDLGFLLPPMQSPEGVAVAAANIKAVQAYLPVPFAFETGVSYLQPAVGELADGAFFAAVAEAADCGILLDLHNVWANECNGRQPVLDLVAQLPLDRVWELHLAGGQQLDGFWVDAHSDLVPAPVMDLARRVVPQLPNLRAIIFEIMPEYATANGLSSEQLLEQLRALQDLWLLRGTGAVAGPTSRPAVREPSPAPALPSPRAWEETLGAAVAGTPIEGELGDRLITDPGVGVLRRLIAAVRAGRVADSLKLTTHLLLLTLGEDGLQQVFRDFWRSVPSEPMASNEAQRFAAYLEDHVEERVPYLSEVVAFELTAHQVLIEGEPRTLSFPYDPEPVLAALREGRLPNTIAPGQYEVTIEPPSQ
jgi:uncharacterized protein